jgi:NAD(P)-dependent dehydrogenase (short-subunit alcohol dehydrogenase family)
MSKPKVAFITGANRGIGFEIAKQLGQQGIIVLVGSRDEGRGRTAADQLAKEGIDAHVVTVDVASEESIKQAAETITKDYGRLDILVNNAGISRDQGLKPSEMPLQAMRETYETNVFGVVGVTNALLPLLRKSEAARIVNVSSGMGSLASAADPSSPSAMLNLLAYNSSKAALNSVTLEYAKEFRGTPIKINSADPGYVFGDRTPADGAKATVRLATLPDDGPSGTFQGEHGPVTW